MRADSGATAPSAARVSDNSEEASQVVIHWHWQLGGCVCVLTAQSQNPTNPAAGSVAALNSQLLAGAHGESDA
jgi:hypothetical protein